MKAVTCRKPVECRLGRMQAKLGVVGHSVGSEGVSEVDDAEAGAKIEAAGEGRSQLRTGSESAGFDSKSS